MADSAVSREHPMHDDGLTICAISVIAGMAADILHEGVGHALIALLTGAQSGVVSTVAWSSSYDSRLVEAGGTLVNLAAGILFWMALRAAKNASVRPRFFLLACTAFNLFDGTGYFFFSGVTDFGDWAQVIANVYPHWLWRTLLVVAGITAYLGAAVVVGSALVRYVGVLSIEHGRWRKITWTSYLSSIVLSGVAGLLNPLGLQLVWQSALPASAGANSGLLWMKYYIPRKIEPERAPQSIDRSYSWIGTAAILALAFIFILGRGITLHR